MKKPTMIGQAEELTRKMQPGCSEFVRGHFEDTLTVMKKRDWMHSGKDLIDGEGPANNRLDPATKSFYIILDEYGFRIRKIIKRGNSIHAAYD